MIFGGPIQTRESYKASDDCQKTLGWTLGSSTLQYLHHVTTDVREQFIVVVTFEEQVF